MRKPPSLSLGVFETALFESTLSGDSLYYLYHALIFILGIIDVTNEIESMDEKLTTSANYQKAITGGKSGYVTSYTGPGDLSEMDVFSGFHNSEVGGRGPAPSNALVA